LTSYQGNAEFPSFSPDGSQVAFSWNGEKQDNYDIYVKLVDGGTPLRLTTDAAVDTAPQWSPDGRWIAFVRADVRMRSGALHLISPIGGPERKVVDRVSGPASWMPDSKSLLITRGPEAGEPQGIFMITIGTGEVRRLTTAPGSGRDVFPSVSPDGHILAFSRTNSSRFDLYVTPLSGGAVRRLTNDARFIYGLVWLDNREIVFSSNMPDGQILQRVPSDGRSAARPVEGVQGQAIYPAISHTAKGPARLGYTRYTSDYNIWRAEIAISDNGTARILTPPGPVIASTRNDFSAQYSPDGKRMVFTSNRIGATEVWMASSDGTNPVQLTTFRQSVFAGLPRWSPDGRQIVFEALTGGNGDIYVISADGGVPKRLTADPSDESRASWSQDGRWIYFRSNRSGKDQIWKIPATEPYKPAVQITRNGGWEGVESWDGKLLYFVNPAVDEALWSIPVGGGEESRVLPSVTAEYWSVAEKGIYFVESKAAGMRSMQFFDSGTRKITPLFNIMKPLLQTAPGLTVTRDGRWIAWDQADLEQSDLMLLENFR
jgi:Tol biopolymer transport system component